MAVSASPAFQFYPTDFLSDDAVVLMTNEQVGAYVLLLCHAWQRPDGLPAAESSLARLCRCTENRFRKNIWPALEKKFHHNDQGRLYNPRLERVRSDQAEFKRRKSDAGKLGVKARVERQHRLSIAEAEPKQCESSVDGLLEADGQQNGSPLSLSSSLPSSTVRREIKDLSISDGDEIADRAAAFIQRYSAAYLHHRRRNYYRRDSLEFPTACQVVGTYTDDAHLDRLVALWLTCDHKFARDGSRTIPQFAAMAGWCDDQLKAQDEQANDPWLKGETA